MSTVLPTEEDVLAFLVLNAALGELMIGARSEEHQAMLDAISNWKANEWSDGVEGIAYGRLLSHDRIHTAAIADSERRYAVECAEREVLRTAEHQLRAPSVSTYDDMRGAVWSLWAARRGVR